MTGPFVPFELELKERSRLRERRLFLEKGLGLRSSFVLETIGGLLALRLLYVCVKGSYLWPLSLAESIW